MAVAEFSALPEFDEAPRPDEAAVNALYAIAAISRIMHGDLVQKAGAELDGSPLPSLSPYALGGLAVALEILADSALSSLPPSP